MKPKKICIVEGCSYPLFAKRYCSSHYKSLYLHPRIKKKQSIKIKSISAKKIIQIKELRKIEIELDRNPFNHYCFFYKNDRKMEYHHILPKSQYVKYITNPLNLLPIGRKAHDILTFGDFNAIKELPNLLSYLKIMNNLNHEYYIRYCNNHNIDIPL